MEEEEDPSAKLLGLIKSSGLWSSDKAAQEAELAEEGFGIVKDGGGILIPPRSLLEAEEFCLSELFERKGDGDDGVEGVDGEFEVISPKSFRALRITEWTRASGPNASLIISFSPWS